MKRTTIPRVDYDRLTREELIARLEVLEGGATITAKAKRDRPSRPFCFDAYPKKHVALKVAYFGWNYNGFASQRSYKPIDASNYSNTNDKQKDQNNNLRSNITTVEDVLFAALQRCRLIDSPRTCNYSRCGRTDTGVSSTGQVVALTIRSSSKKLSGESTAEQMVDLPLCTMLNRSLPLDIRVLGWSEVPEGFNARFDCIGREYRYFFSPLGLNLERMREAARRLVGIHDFRNFCRKDPSREIKNYERQIFRADIFNQNDDQSSGFGHFIIHGSAFLYHQVRCIMEVLFRIGRGLEPVEVIDYLLDVEKCRSRPNYDLASEIPLVLTDCRYSPEKVALEWKINDEERPMLEADLFNLWKDLQTKSLTVDLIRGNTPGSVAFMGKPSGPHIYPAEQSSYNKN